MECYPYEIDNIYTNDSTCNYNNYSTYDSAPYDSIGECYAAVGISAKISNITKPKSTENIERVVYQSAMTLSVLSLLAFILLLLWWWKLWIFLKINLLKINYSIFKLFKTNNYFSNFL